MLKNLFQQEDLNFLLTNRVPRLALTRFMGWYAGIRSPRLTKLSIAAWKLFSDLDLSEAREQTYESLRDCFVRQLRPGLRPVDMRRELLTSPCDAIVGACGPVAGREVFQAKGFPYSMDELFGPTQDTTAFADGFFVTLRLTSSMYHRFHAPADLRVEHVTFHSGDTWNVNPIALARVQRLFCRNERAVLRTRLESGHELALVPVAAILVASLRLHCVDAQLDARWRGPHELPCDVSYAKGEEMGWFEHGSTIIVFAPKGFALADGLKQGAQIRMGEPLLRLPSKA